jgi:hypothetical protein
MRAGRQPRLLLASGAASDQTCWRNRGPTRMRQIPAIALLMLAFTPAAASGMYRCVGSAGETVYTSDTRGHSNCRSMNPPANPPSTQTDGSGTRRGAVYKFERDGVTHYSNIRPSGRHQVLFTYVDRCFACAIDSTVDWRHTRLNPDAFAAEVAEIAARHKVDAALVRAVMHAESHFNPLAISRKGAQGLMQLMPATAGDLGVLDPFDPRENIEGGVAYLAQMLGRFNGDERLAAAAYNAGPGAVQRHGGVPPFAETQVYVERVAILRERYAEANGGAGAGSAAAD